VDNPRALLREHLREAADWLAARQGYGIKHYPGGQDHDQSTHGSGGGGGSVTGGSEASRARVGDIAGDAGIDAPIVLADGTGTTGQAADTSPDGVITVYPEALALTDKQLGGVLAHENSHVQLNHVPQSTIDKPMRELAQEITEPGDDWRDVYIDNGGVSPYSTSFFRGPYIRDSAGRISAPYYRQAVRETLAEVARLRYEGGYVSPMWSDLYDQVTSAASTKSYFGAAHKSVNEVTRDYDATLTRFAFDVLNGNSDAVDFRRSHKALIRSLALDAYVEGLREGGVSADEMDDEDHAAVRAWIDEQAAHVNDFAAWLAGGEPRNSEAKRRELAERVALWVQALDNLGGLGRAAALANTMCTWRVGDTEHCDTCRELDGARHRLKWFTSKGYIPREVGSDTLECGGYNCMCQLVNEKGERVL
jgi:hypothetical protein